MIKFDGIEFNDQKGVDSYIALQEILEESLFDDDSEDNSEFQLSESFKGSNEDVSSYFEYEYEAEQELVFES